MNGFGRVKMGHGLNMNGLNTGLIVCGLEWVESNMDQVIPDPTQLISFISPLFFKHNLASNLLFFYLTPSGFNYTQKSIDDHGPPKIDTHGLQKTKY